MAKTKSKRAATRNAAKIRQAHSTQFEERVVQRPAPQVRRAVKRRQRRTGLAGFVSEFPVLSSALGLVLVALLGWGTFNAARANHLGPFAIATNSCAWATNPSAFTVKGTIVRKYSHEPQQCITEATKGSYIATIHTAKGDISLYLDQTKAPRATNNFVFLATHKFYDGLTFHRVVPNFIIQAGDPRSADPKADTTKSVTDGSDGPGYTFKDILPHAADVYTPGAVAMADKNSDPSTSGSQFFITTADDTKALTNSYIFFARVAPDNLATAEKIMQGEPIISLSITFDAKGVPGALPGASTATPAPPTATPHP